MEGAFMEAVTTVVEAKRKEWVQVPWARGRLKKEAMLGQLGVRRCAWGFLEQWGQAFLAEMT